MESHDRNRLCKIVREKTRGNHRGHIRMRKRVLTASTLLLLIVSLLAVRSLAQSASPKNADLARVDAIIAKMTLEEKIDYIGGTGFAVRAMPRLGLPAL